MKMESLNKKLLPIEILSVNKATADLPQTKVKFKLSVQKPDRSNEVVKVSGIKLDNYLNNPVVLFNHNPDEPIGIGEDLHVEGDALIGTVNFSRMSTRSVQIADMVEGGYLNAVSIGFIPLSSNEYKITPEMRKSGEYYPYTSVSKLYETSELLEFSIVSLPANPSAIVTNSFSIDMIEETETKQIEEPMDDKLKAQILVKVGKVLNKSNLENLQMAMELIQEVIDSSMAEDPTETPAEPIPAEAPKAIENSIDFNDEVQARILATIK